MSLKAIFAKHILKFHREATTSRGSMNERPVWYVKIYDSAIPDIYGIGEAAPLKGLSPRFDHNYEKKFQEACMIISGMKPQESRQAVNELVKNLGLEHYPSIAFAFETALLDLLHGGNRSIRENDFTNGNMGIPINGLIWMGDKKDMEQQVAKKLEEGCSCLKLKIGGIEFKDELSILRSIRKKFPADKLTIRLDANGAFNAETAKEKLEGLAQFEIHSIEQPIQHGQIEEMHKLCSKTPIPIALDEELIGLHGVHEKAELVKAINPQFIILKPTLIGGLQSCREWINIADSFKIGWWITSALESNIGLNAIAQFTYSRNINTFQGLGTGLLFNNNISSPLFYDKGFIKYDVSKAWDEKKLDQLFKND